MEYLTPLFFFFSSHKEPQTRNLVFQRKLLNALKILEPHVNESPDWQHGGGLLLSVLTLREQFQSGVPPQPENVFALLAMAENLATKYTFATSEPTLRSAERTAIQEDVRTSISIELAALLTYHVTVMPYEDFLIARNTLLHTLPLPNDVLRVISNETYNFTGKIY